MNNNRTLINIPISLTLIFVVLQILGTINWPWYIIIAPILIYLGILFIISILTLLVIITLLVLKLKKNK